MWRARFQNFQSLAFKLNLWHLFENSILLTKICKNQRKYQFHYLEKGAHELRRATTTKSRRIEHLFIRVKSNPILLILLSNLNPYPCLIICEQFIFTTQWIICKKSSHSLYNRGPSNKVDKYVSGTFCWFYN